ncbi:MAG: 3-phenylpropionate/trans-cinnamate dioxygenase ferredoxin reductase component [Frankiales bacterium]|nr:3-phenylpropionate/trans-cinnamate dioxygenase ferredoxin reductase component [Frankiales bacterium]
MSPPYVIVGASLAGAKAAETLREQGFDGGVVLIGEEQERPYERPPLSKDYLLGKAGREKIYVHDEEFYSEHDVDLRLGVVVSAIDRDAHEIELSDGSRQRYDKLLLSTGSVVRRIPNTDMDGVHYLRRVEDSDALRSAFIDSARVVVVGAGWIGLEGAAAARHHGCEVALIDPEPAPLNRVFGPELGNVFADLHRDNGVDLRLGAGLAEVRPGPVVVTDTGDEIAADAVLIGVGVRPAIELAEQAGLEVDDGIRVTDRLQTTRDPDIFAAGDCMNADHPFYRRPIRVEHWANALNAGPAAAKSMLGMGEPYDRVPYFYSDQYDLGLEFTGWFEPGGYARVAYRGDPAKREFIAFWLDAEGRVLAGMNVNVWDVIEPIQALIRSRRPVDPAALANPEKPLESLISE